jgi:hypothetical protein
VGECSRRGFSVYDYYDYDFPFGNFTFGDEEVPDAPPDDPTLTSGVSEPSSENRSGFFGGLCDMRILPFYARARSRLPGASIWPSAICCLTFCATRGAFGKLTSSRSVSTSNAPRMKSCTARSSRI